MSYSSDDLRRNAETTLDDEVLLTWAADEIDGLRRRCAAFETALTEISCPSQTKDLLWWQQLAREALTD